MKYQKALGDPATKSGELKNILLNLFNWSKISYKISLNNDARTIRKWRKDRPYLYEIIEKGFAFEEFVKTAQEKIDDLKKLENSLNKDQLK